MNRYVNMIAGLLVLILLAGCGGGVEQARPPRKVPGVSGSTGITEPAAKATAEEFNYHGWKAIRMSNGLVTLVAVPEIGGRIIEYKLGDRPLLWVNPNELGKKYDAADAQNRTYRDFGGYKAWPAPLSKWQGPPDPEGSSLDSGRWTSQIITGRGRRVEVELKSPADKTVTGLQITRNIVMYTGTTNVVITEKFENVSDHEVEWSIQHTSQLLGSLAEDAEFSPESKVYFPLNPDSKHKRRFVYLNESGVDQFSPIEDNSLLEVSYRGHAGRIGADSMGGWAAHLDSISNYAFVQRFTERQLQDYPEQNSTITVRTSSEHSYMELGILSPLERIAPGDTAESRVEWYATRVAGPVRHVSEVAAVNERLKVTKTADEFKITGKLGLFAPGELDIYLKDKDGKPLGETLKIKASVSEMVELDKALPVEKNAATLVAELKNSQGSPLGQVASVSVAPTLAKAEASASAEPTKDTDKE